MAALLQGLMTILALVLRPVGVKDVWLGVDVNEISTAGTCTHRDAFLRLDGDAQHGYEQWVVFETPGDACSLRATHGVSAPNIEPVPSTRCDQVIGNMCITW